MAKNTKRNKKKNKKKSLKLKLVKEKKSLAQRLNLKDETLHFAVAGILLFIAIFMGAAPFAASGPVGTFLYEKLSIFLGVGYYLVPISFLILAMTFYADIKRKFNKVKIFGILLFLISALGFIDLISGKGGWLGHILSKMENYLGSAMSVILSLILVAISQVIIFDTVPKIGRGEEDDNARDDLSEEEE